MDPNLINLYFKDNYTDPNIFFAFFITFIIFIFIIIISLNLEITIIKLDWDNKRCDNIFLSGFINETSDPFVFKEDNISYCLKKYIYDNSNIKQYIEHLKEKIIYLLNYSNTQINTKTKIFYKKTNKEINDKYNDTKNKINYMNRKEGNKKIVQNNINNINNIKNKKLKKGLYNLYLYDKENGLEKEYSNPSYKKYINNSNETSE